MYLWITHASSLFEKVVVLGVSFAVIKYHDQKQPEEERAYFRLWL